jgi:hypothetical protein
MAPWLSARELPSEFREGLIYLTPTLKDGRQMRFFTDTGGGWNAIASELGDKYGWPVHQREKRDGTAKLTDMPAFRQGLGIPMAGLNNWLGGLLMLEPRSRIDRHGGGEFDGFLGARWHAEKIIAFDYLSQRMSVLPVLPDVSEFAELPLGFRKNDAGRYTNAFPSMTISVAGRIIPMLFDTGASAWPTAAAKQAMHTEADRVATSFIVASIFDQWLVEHPDWLVLERGCQLSGEAMIRIPEVEIGSVSVGPVWFTRRADSSFHEYMSPMMDRRVDGALGGSALQHLRVIVDYPNERAYVQAAIP